MIRYPRGNGVTRIGAARWRPSSRPGPYIREGKDLALLTIGPAVRNDAAWAAEQAAGEGISVHADLRFAKPLMKDCCTASATRRVITVEGRSRKRRSRCSCPAL